ncbi:MAG: hypothetical protein EOM50_19900 [Erysipelotrichia bacterium]|nr:hypothetical protein [Erysipelotrichia bacterium]NCC55250.1 hypothetical protein [Erysipelotrichia bacterium]
MKNLTMNKAKLTEVLNNGLVFVSAEEKQNYNDKSKMDYIATVLSPDCNETITVKCVEPFPREIKAMDRVDFMNCEVIFKGRGTGTFGTNIMAELQLTVNAQKMVKVG